MFVFILQLAEDRQFTVFLHATSGKKVGLCPDAVFYYEPEVRGPGLVMQRKR